VGNKIFYQGPSSISGSTSGNQKTTMGTQLQKHGQMGTTLKQQKKHQNMGSHGHQVDPTTSITHQVSRITKKGAIHEKKHAPGSISQDTVE
jgi:hypothetical protein